ncbi:uncharacterized protein LOC116254111 isoform X2 [Nymphaea colorata]|uniref:uncharacterized protein LOC116254111 isoform X2 n=1 Tax=Nymphaea colorata TaxID=210225 RepID=UPI00129D473C|nr:uncharacterized protein LOC116254111 isoform X2 [Nymphaea colorata]
MPACKHLSLRVCHRTYETTTGPTARTRNTNKQEKEKKQDRERSRSCCIHKGSLLLQSKTSNSGIRALVFRSQIMDSPTSGANASSSFLANNIEVDISTKTKFKCIYQPERFHQVSLITSSAGRLTNFHDYEVQELRR